MIIYIIAVRDTRSHVRALGADVTFLLLLFFFSEPIGSSQQRVGPNGYVREGLRDNWEERRADRDADSRRERARERRGRGALLRNEFM